MEEESIELQIMVKNDGKTKAIDAIEPNGSIE